MRLRRAAAAATAALTVLATGCSVVPSDTVATVGDVDIPMDDLDQLMSRSSAGYQLSPDRLALARTAQEIGVLDRAVLDDGLRTFVTASADPDLADTVRLDQARIPQVCPEGGAEDGDATDQACSPELVDQLFEDQREAAGAGWSDGLDELGLSEARWRDVFGGIVVTELAGLYQSGGEPFDLAMTDLAATMQANLVGQLVNAEVFRQAHAELGLELDQEAIAAETDRILAQAQFESDAVAEAVLGLSGYSMESFEELFIATQLRDVELQQLQDPADIEQLNDFYEQLDVTIAPRFGDWDGETRTVTPPERLDGGTEAT